MRWESTFLIGRVHANLRKPSRGRRASPGGAWLLLLWAVTAAPAAHAVGGRLLATGGVTQLEGAAGGGLVPWALIAGYGTRDEVGFTGFATWVDTGDFSLRSAGAAIGIHDRLELSFANQRFDLGDTVPGASIVQHVLGAKLRLFGDAVYDQDRAWPQVAVGLQYKRNLDFAVPRLLGARDDDGVDFYLAATKLYLGGLFGRNVLLNATVRGTRANQFGILGFGGDRRAGYRPQFEGSAAVFLRDDLAIGVEGRTRPDNLRAFEENDVFDVFAAWLPHKHCAVTLAYAGLGRIADRTGQGALYVSGQISF